MFYSANERKKTSEHVDNQYMDIPCGFHVAENRQRGQIGLVSLVIYNSCN